MHREACGTASYMTFWLILSLSSCCYLFSISFSCVFVRFTTQQKKFHVFMSAAFPSPYLHNHEPVAWLGSGSSYRGVSRVRLMAVSRHAVDDGSVCFLTLSMGKNEEYWIRQWKLCDETRVWRMILFNPHLKSWGYFFSWSGLVMFFAPDTREPCLLLQR